MKKLWIIVIIILLLIVAGILLWPNNYEEILPEETCDGIIMGKPMFYPPEDFCNEYASDFGKECSDSSQCEGDCLADEDEVRKREEIEGLENPIMINGACSQYKSTFGGYYVHNGTVFGYITV